MGREYNPAGKFVYFCAAGLIFFLLASCSTSKKDFTWHSSQEVSPEEVQKQNELESPENKDLQGAQKSFDLGDHAGLSQENQKTLSRPAENDPGDQILFNMGLIYTDVENPQRDLGKALNSFRTVLKEYPQSPLAEEAHVLVGVLQENQKLGQMVQQFKQENEELSQTVQKFKHENEKMSQAVQKFKQENQELNRVIEKFKQVDIDVEEKKREKAR